MTEITWLAGGYRIEHRNRRITFVAPHDAPMNYQTVTRILNELAMDDIMPELSKRTRDTLKRHGYTTTAHLKNAPKSELRTIPGLGPVGLREIETALGHTP